MIDFKNKKILITGATGGIGYSLVEKFNLLGGSILATGTNEEKLNDLKKKYSKIKTIKFDISKHDEIENMIDKATSELDGLDILINNAGITSDNLSLRMKKNEWERARDLLLRAKKEDIGNSEIYKILGKIYKGMGQSSLAIEQFENYLKINPNSRDKSMIQGYIRSLR